MDATVLSDPAVAGYINENFAPVLLDVNSTEGAAFLKGHSLKAISPVVVLYAMGGREIDRWTGVPDAQEFVAFLTDVLRGDHFAALESRARSDPAYLDDYDRAAQFGRRLYERDDKRAREVLLRASRMDPEGRRPEAVDIDYLLARLVPSEERRAALTAYARRYPEGRHTVKAHRELVLFYEEIDSYAYLHGHGALRGPWERAAYARALAFSGKRPELGLALIDEALRAEPDNARYHDTRAECLSRLGRYDEAIEEETVALAKATRPEEQAEFRRALYELRKRKE